MDFHTEQVLAGAVGRLGADRMALGLSAVPNEKRGDMDVVAMLRKSNADLMVLLKAEQSLNKLRLEDCLELGELVRVAAVALDRVATFVPDVPQSFEHSLEEVTDIADAAHVVIEKGLDSFNNKPDLAARAAKAEG